MAFPLSITFNNYEHTRNEIVIVVPSEVTACCAFSSLLPVPHSTWSAFMSRELNGLVVLEHLMNAFRTL
jgi:hypothetical protein